MSIVACINARSVYVTPAERPAVELLFPAAMLLACLVIPALGLFALYRHATTRAERKKSFCRFDWTLRENDLEQGSTNQITLAKSHLIDDVSSKLGEHADQLTEVIPTYLETIQTGQMVNYPHKDAVNDPDDTGSKHPVVNSISARHFVSTGSAVQHINVEATQNPRPICRCQKCCESKHRCVKKLKST